MSAETTAAAPPWTPMHDAVIRKCYGRLPNREIARRMGKTAHQVVGRAKHLGLIAPVMWTEREIALVRRHYRGGDSAALTALVELTGKARHQVRAKARALGLARVKERRWTPDDDYGLSILWGRKPDKAVAKKLGRTVAACKIRATRALKRSRQDGIRGWTGRGLAKLLGIDEHKVTRQWVVKGWLTPSRLPYRIGQNRPMLFAEDDLVRFLREQPQEYDWRAMDDPSGYYQRIAKAAWEAAGLLPIAEAARRVGMSVEGLRRHVRQGWLPGIYGHTTGGAGVLYVREADLATWKPKRPELVGHRGRGKAVAS